MADGKYVIRCTHSLLCEHILSERDYLLIMCVVSAQCTMKVRKQGSLRKPVRDTVSTSGILFDSGEIHLITKVQRLDQSYQRQHFFSCSSPPSPKCGLHMTLRFGMPGFPDSRDFMTIHNCDDTVSHGYLTAERDDSCPRDSQPESAEG
jgi:hypothetical protein